MSVSGVSVSGEVEASKVAPGFERVAEVFTENFRDIRDTGSAFAAVIDGDLVVDLWGGVADDRDATPWTSDTLAVLHAGTKGVVATALLMLVERGLLDLNEPVARYWPEFGRAGKEAVTVATLASHTSGLPGIDGDVTFSWLCDELVRRVAGRARVLLDTLHAAVASA